MNRKEAIDIIRKNIPHLGIGAAEMTEALNELIPEFRESEDERVRKWLIQYIKDTHPIANYWNGAPKISDVLSWLEKQKEQRLLSIGAASEWLRNHVCNYVNSEYNEFHKCVEYDGSIDKERLINDFEEAMQKEQKPAWSEEDDKMLGGVYSSYDIAKAYVEGQNNILTNLDKYNLMRRTKSPSSDLKESEKPVPANLEEAAKECNSNLQLQEYFIKGGIWQKEQMMKEAVPFYEILEAVPPGPERDKVKLIICKED